MRITALLLLVFGSAQCYLINLYNDRATPITIATTRNGVSSSVTLPAASNGVASLTQMGEFGSGESMRFEYLNLHTATHPSSWANYVDIEAGYANQPVNTDVAMLVLLDDSRIMCNWMENPLCFIPEINSYDYTQLLTIPYLFGVPIQIRFTNRAH